MTGTTVKLSALSLLTALLAGSAVAVEVGDMVCVEGFIMDLFCIDLGTLLDNRSVRTLEGPDRHSVHCLVDVPQCVTSPFEVLLDPEIMQSGELYSRGWRLDDAGKDMLVEEARRVGTRCSTCDGGGSLRRGFRAAVTGTVENLGDSGTPPLLKVSNIQATAGEGAVDKATACMEINGNSTEPIRPPNMIVAAGGLSSNFYTHGILMIVGWGFLLPMGALFGKFFKHRPDGLWFKIHRIVQTIGLAISLGGYFFALYHFDAFADVGDSTTINYEHAVAGTVTMILGILQPINAVFRPHPPEVGEQKTSARFGWEVLHKGLGWLSILLAIATIGMGTTLLPDLEDHKRFQLAYGLGCGGILGLLLVALLFDKYNYDPPPPVDPKDMVEEESAMVPT